MNVSLIAPCMFITHNNQEDINQENIRILMLLKFLESVARIDCSDGDEIIISESGTKPRLEKIIKSAMKDVKCFKYIFTKTDNYVNITPSIYSGLRSANIKNKCIFANVDILIQKSLFDEIKKFYSNTDNEKYWLLLISQYFICDVVKDSEFISSFINNEMDDDKNYTSSYTEKNDAMLQYLTNSKNRNKKIPVKTWVKQHNKNRLNESIHFDPALPANNIIVFPNDYVKWIKDPEKYQYYSDCCWLFLFKEKGYLPYYIADKALSFHIIDSVTQLPTYFTRYTIKDNTEGMHNAEQYFYWIEHYPEMCPALIFNLYKTRHKNIDLYIKKYIEFLKPIAKDIYKNYIKPYDDLNSRFDIEAFNNYFG